MANYTIQFGDTLSQIARSNKRTIAELMAINPQIKDPDKIYAGQTLNVPSSEIPIMPASSLPNTSQQQQGQSQGQQDVDYSQYDTGDPIRKFNLALLKMLEQAQAGETKMGQEKAQLRREAYRSGQEVFTGEEAKMTPEAKMAALQRNVEMFNPSIAAATTKVEQLGRISDLIVKTYGQDFTKLIPATSEDAAVFQKAMAAGWTPTADILQKYGKYFTTEDWNALVEAKAKVEEAERAPVQPPSSVQEYEYYKKQEEVAGRIPKSYGEFSATQKAPTAAQETTALYANRLEQAESTFNQLENYINNISAFELAKQQKLPNWLRSAEYQSFDQAQRNFINATLRRESGAVISPQEFDNAEKQYFPQPGDKPETLAQKKLNRQQIISGFISGAGNAYTPSQFLSGQGNIITQPDGTQWQHNANGSYTRIK